MPSVLAGVAMSLDGYEGLESAPIELERMRVVEYPWFTHLRFRVSR
jgi:hypothetical protein